MLVKGIAAGFAATAVLTVLMIVKAAMGVMPAFNAIRDLTQILGGFGLPASPAMGWIAHVLLGSVVWGGLYAVLHDKLPGSGALSGIVFGLLAWLGMMLVFMPMAGHGLFALGIGPMATMATLVLHVIYGAVLGVVYDRIRDPATV